MQYIKQLIIELFINLINFSHFLSHFQGLLWALDVGIVNTLEQPIRRCSPKIVAINTADGKVVKSIDVSDLVTAESRLQFLIVDYGADNKPFV